MFIQKKYLVTSIAPQLELIRKFPLAAIVTSGPQGLIANHVPFIVDELAQEDGTVKLRLRAHMARINVQLKDLEVVDDVLIIFQAADSYISPSYYVKTKPETGKVVPTWNFNCVHVHGKPRVNDDAEFILRQMNDLTNLEESRLEGKKPWTVDEAPENYRNLLVKAVRGLEIDVVVTEGKWKVNQDKPREDVDGVVAGMNTHGDNSYLAKATIDAYESNNWAQA